MVLTFYGTRIFTDKHGLGKNIYVPGLFNSAVTCHCEAYFAEAISGLQHGDCFALLAMTYAESLELNSPDLRPELDERHAEGLRPEHAEGLRKIRVIRAIRVL